MSKIYVDQESLRLTLQTGVDISGSSARAIKFLKPDQSTTGSWDATVTGTEDLYYDFDGSELDVSGEWTFWAFVTFGDGRTAPGEPVFMKVYEEGV